MSRAAALPTLHGCMLFTRSQLLEAVARRGHADGLESKRPLGAAMVAGALVGLSALGCGIVDRVESRAPGVDASVAPDAACADPGTDAQAAPGGRRLSAGDGNTCGIRDDGTVACWGGGPIDMPPAGTFVRVAVGSAHACGIRTSGEVECWGEGATFVPVDSSCSWPECGQANPPAGRFIEIAAGYDQTCGLRPDHTVECWGNVRNAGPPPRPFVQLDTWSGGCAVDASGQIACWPLPLLEFEADGGYVPRDTLREVSLSDSCICYLYTNREADCWFYQAGWGGWGAPGFGLPGDYYVPSQVYTWTHGGVAEVSCGFGDACAIFEDGTLSCGFTSASGAMTPIDGTFTEIACGRSHCCAMRTEGTAECWNGSDMPPSFPRGSAAKAETCIAPGFRCCRD